MVDLGEREISPWLKEHSAQFRWIYQPKESEIGQREQHVFPTVQDKGHIIGYIKVGVNRVYVHDFDEIIELPRNTAMIYDTLILPEYRGHGIASFMITETVRLLRQRGFDNLWCHIPPWNIPSIRAYSRAGFRRVAHVKFMRFLKWQFYSGDVQAVMEEAQRKVRRLRSGGRDLQAG
jgi:ribosomal protein S18 acetylase RimI-like enzyme